MHNTTLSSLGNAAIAYATRNLAIFPCLPRRKAPATRYGCRDATKDLAQVAAWWRENPAFNVAVATGPVSKVFVLDVRSWSTLGSLNPGGWLWDLAVTPDGKRIAVIDSAGVKLWDVRGVQNQATIYTDNSVDQIAFTSSGKMLATRGDNASCELQGAVSAIGQLRQVEKNPDQTVGRTAQPIWIAGAGRPLPRGEHAHEGVELVGD